MASVAADYLPILLFLGVALGLSMAFVVLPMLVSRLTGANKPYPDKLTEYECGFPAFEDSRAQFDVRFYLVAILFIVFDLEAAFLFPWAVTVFEPRLGRLDRDDDLPRRACARPGLCLEERRAGMGVILDAAGRPMQPAAAGDTAARSLYLQPDPVRGVGQGLPRHHHRGSVPVGADRFALVDDLRPRLLRGRDDPCEHAALRS